MRLLTGIALALAGLGATAYFGIATENDKVAVDRLAALVRIAAESSRPAQRASELRQEKVAAAMKSDAAQPDPRQPMSDPQLGPPAVLPDTQPAQMLQAPIKGLVGDAGTMPIQRPFGMAKPEDDRSRRELARSIQTELKRVGCLEGEVDGIWTGSAMRAMKSFTEHVNASLPTEEPDYILLTLLQGHSAKACGKECPAGQVIANDGRCQPRAIVTAASRGIVPRQSKSQTAAMPSQAAANVALAAATTPANSGAVSAEVDSPPADVIAAAEPTKTKGSVTAELGKPNAAAATTKRKQSPLESPPPASSTPRFVQRFTPPQPSYLGRNSLPGPTGIRAGSLPGPSRAILFQNLARSAP